MNNEFFLASFFCTSCQQPIKLEPSLLDNNAIEETLVSIQTTDRVHDKPSLPPTRKDEAGNPKGGNPIHDSFVVLSRSQVAAGSGGNPKSVSSPKESGIENKGSLSHRLKVASRLFDILSGVSEVDHPLCQECADELTVRLEKRLSELRKDRESYAAYLQSLEDESTEEFKESPEDLETLKEQEESTLRVLRDLEKESKLLSEELQSVESELKDLDDAELRWEYLFRNMLIFASYWQDVEWTEINAALGQSLLLLDTLASKLGFIFKT
ncbi:Beclin-1 [Phlyctochytrium bullatum]|nr:Beclin-1 [Phlyctochytrium bullatum]